MQTIINQHVNKIFTRLSERGYEFSDEEDKNFLENVFSETLTEFSHLINKSVPTNDSTIRDQLHQLLQLKGTSPTQATKGRQSGYNVFTKEYIANHPGTKVTEVGGIWKQLTQAEKDEFNQKAVQINQANGIVPGMKTGGGSSTRKLSGYNLFTREKMPELKNMASVGAAWKALGPDGQQVYKTQASAL